MSTSDIPMPAALAQADWWCATSAWAVAEIDAAGRRHPTADLLPQAFPLLAPTFDRVAAMVYRAHCRELLDRVAHGQPTQPGTAAECCVMLCRTSLAGPLNIRAAVLYTRMWLAAGLPPAEVADIGGFYESVAGSEIDQAEAWLRDRLRQRWRLLAQP